MTEKEIRLREIDRRLRETSDKRLIGLLNRAYWAVYFGTAPERGKWSEKPKSVPDALVKSSNSALGRDLAKV
jgi:hypothetical protein